MDTYLIRVAILIAIAVIYAAFDLFNKREVPNIFAYCALAVALVALLLSGGSLYLPLAIAAVIALAGYLTYRTGFLGAGDVFEFVTIALLIPLQPIPLFSQAPQLGLPFILSVFIASGYFAVVAMLIYYLVFSEKTTFERRFKIENSKVYLALMLLFTYAILAYALNLFLGFSIFRTALLVLLAVPLAILPIFEKLINYRMIEMIYPSKLVPDDMIALNLMSSSEIRYFERASKKFNRLATTQLIGEIRLVKKKLPVYRKGTPLAALVLLGIVFSLLFGNLLLLILL